MKPRVVLPGIEFTRFVILAVAAVAGTAFFGPRPVLGQVPPASPAWLPADASYDAPFFPDARYDSAVKSPDEILGSKLGSRPMLHAEMERCLAAWRDSKRLVLNTYGHTHERRTLYYGVITSEKNQARLAAIQEANGKLADPRKLKDAGEAQRIIAENPAVAWLAYSIHGDEMSSTDAAIAVIYHLLASNDPETAKLLDELVVIVDPLMNPDGRDRFIRMLDQFAGYAPNLDLAAMQHAGRWPWGRGNHYFFDMNRDWIVGTQPETRGRRKAICEWSPQLLVDSHEMGGDDTYLFYPAREPFNPHVSPNVLKWWATYAGDQARAFDRYGWSYYTREWADYWYSGYSDTWAALRGAVAILYEQARVGVGAVRQSTGRTLTYRESVHHQAVSSMANLATLRANRTAMLTDFHRHNRETLGLEAGGPPERTFLIVPGANAARDRAFLDNLTNQGIEIGVASRKFTARATSIFRETTDAREFPAGTWVVSTRQPAGRLAAAILDFDPRVTPEFLNEERRELETRQRSRIYDVTGFCVAMGMAIDGWWVDGSVADVKPFAPDAPAKGMVQAADRPYAYVIDGGDDAAARTLAHLLQSGVRVRVAEDEFRSEGRSFPRGSLLIRVRENGAELSRQLQQAAEAAGITIYAARTGRSPDDGPDLGGGHFMLLERPRVAIAANTPVDTVSLGTICNLFDAEIGLPLSLLDVAGGENGPDLRRYNVLILPATADDGAVYGHWADELKTWVNAGGTLIAVGNAATPLMDKEKGISAVRPRTAVIAELDQYAEAVARERAAGRTPVDPGRIWDHAGKAAASSKPATSDSMNGGEGDDGDEDDEGKESSAERLDEWRRNFPPNGVILRAELDAEHWLTFGCIDVRRGAGGGTGAASGDAGGANAAGAAATGAARPNPLDGSSAAYRSVLSQIGATPSGLRPTVELPVYFEGNGVLMAKRPVHTVVRLAEKGRLRLSGLLWPEAAERIADSAYATVERIGHGQVIIFACEPNFRGYYHGSRRLLMNAVLLGPGCGTNPPLPEP